MRQFGAVSERGVTLRTWLSIAGDVPDGFAPCSYFHPLGAALSSRGLGVSAAGSLRVEPAAFWVSCMPDTRTWRHLYKTARWQRLREAQLSDQPLCAYCREAEVIEPAEVVDHVRPHKGDEALFWDPSNLQSLCKSHHDGRKQREERGQKVVSFGADGWPV